MPNGNVVEILLVEDNMDDANLAIRTLQKNQLANHLLHVKDGEEALNYLLHSTNKMPKVILLDLKMPKVDGLDLLKEIKSNEKLKLIPVVVLTSSKEETDIIKAYQLGVNAYIVKPVDFDHFVKAVSDLGLFWLVVNQPPNI
jgi:two-component system response regulator